jgi:hypothetical protein
MTTRLSLGAALVLVSSSLGAQDQPAVGPPIRRIATASAVSTEPLGSVASVRELPGGRLLLNDGGRRRLLLMDTTLKVLEVVLDSLAEVENSYGTRPGALVAYRGDSTLFVDQASYAMLVIDPDGKVARVRSVPRVEDAGRISGGDGGRAGVDAKGRVVYRIQARPGPPKVAPPRGVPWFPQDPDSAFIVGIDLETRKIDTIASYRIPKSLSQVRQSPNGGFNFYEVINPLPSTDEWAVLSDGTVAILRGVDYRVDYLLSDGTSTSSPKLPYDWQRVTEEDKERIIDSVKADRRRASMNSYVQSMMRWVNQFGKEYPDSFTAPQGYRLQNGLARDWKLPRGLTFPPNYIFACAPGETPTMTPDSSASSRPRRESSDPEGGPPGGPSGIPSCIPGPVVVRGGNAPPPPTIRDVGVMAANELPDYRPPFGQGAVRPDADGNLWIRPNLTKPVPGGAVFDIESREGALVDRLQVPPGHSIVGFGAGKVVYLSMRDASGVKLARVRLR